MKYIHKKIKKVIEIFKKIQDPELFISVYDLGLLYDIEIIENDKIYILMTLTSPACPYVEELITSIESSLKKIKNIKDTKIEITFSPPFNQNMISQEGKFLLNIL
jgi:metal-sulfur cluster biosynthetic enzyme